MRSSLAWLSGSLILGVLGASCAQSAHDGQEPLGTAKGLEPSGTAILASRLSTLEDAVFSEPPFGWYGAATSRGHHLFITQSLGAFVGGYGPRAYVLRDEHVVNPEGTELPGQIPFWCPIENAAVNTGTHWLTFLGFDLSVLDLEGELLGSRKLPIDGRAIVWGGDRALLLGAAPGSDTSRGLQQGQFLDASGEPLGPVFDIGPDATALHGGAAFNGSHFVVEYSTVDAVYAVAVSLSGEHGTPVKLASDWGDPNGYGLGINVVSDGEDFLLLYMGSLDDPTDSPNGARYRIASVNSSLELTVGDQQIAQGINPSFAQAVFFGGRYLFTDYYTKAALYVGTDGTPEGSPFDWQPFGDSPQYGLSAGTDGSSPIAFDFLGKATRLDEALAPLDDPPAQFGLGPQVLGFSGAAFDGEDFRVEWQDPARTSVRTTQVDTSGAVLAPGVEPLSGSNASVSGRYLASNGSSVLRLDAKSSTATVTQSDGSVVPLDLAWMELSLGYNPALATNGTDYLVASSNTLTQLALISSAGEITTSGWLGYPGPPNLVFDGAQWLVADSASRALNVTPVSADLTGGSRTSLLTVPGDYGTWLTIASNGAGSLLAWIVNVDNEYQVYGSRLSQDLELLDTPGVLLGTTCAWSPPTATSDGTNYWVTWPEEGTCRPAIRRIAAEPQNGSILLEDAPLVLADPPMNYATLAAHPNGSILMVENPYYSGPLRARVLTQGDSALTNVIGAHF